MTSRSSTPSSEPASRPRRGAAGRIRRAALFIAGLLLIHALLSTAYLGIMSGTNVVKREKKFFASDLQQTEVLVLGDSHAMYLWRRYSSFRLDNWATEGETIVQGHYKLKWFLSRYRPRAVILPLDLNSFSLGALQFGHDFFWVKYVDYVEMAGMTRAYRTWLGKYVKGRFFPYVGEQRTLLEWLGKEVRARPRALPAVRSGLLTGGWGPAPRRNKKKGPAPRRNKKKGPAPGDDPPTVDRSFARLGSAERLALAHSRAQAIITPSGYFDWVVAAYFRKTLDLCRRNGVAVVLVKFPVSREFYDAAAARMPPREYYDRIQQIISGDQDVFVLDLQALFFDRPDMLADVDHPTMGAGAQVLNRKVDRALKHILGRPAPRIRGRR